MKKGIFFGILFLIPLIGIFSQIKAEEYIGDGCEFPVIDSCEGWGNFCVDVEFLYWKTHEDGLAFATKGVNTPVRGSVKELDWKWDPGFRVGIGNIFNCNDWNLSLTYTWFKTHANGSITEPLTDISGLWFTGGLDPIFSHADADWHLRYQTLDLLLSKPFCPGQCFVFEPIIGLRGACTHETYNINYANNVIAPTRTNSRNSQKFWAVGPKGGFRSAWYFCDNWNLFGETAISLLWSEFRVARVDTFLIDGAGNPNNIHDKFNSVRTVAEYTLGFGWDKSICCDAYHLGFQLSWEQQQWFRHNELFYGSINASNLVDNRNTDLSFYGLTLRAQLCF